MATLVTPSDLGPEFDTTQSIQPNKIRLKIGSGLAIAPDGTISVVPQTLNVTKTPHYEYMTIWAEEGGALSDNNTQYSFGNGAVGNIGIRIDDGWEIIGASLHFDTGGSATESMEVQIKDFQSSGGAAAPTLATVTITAAGGGQDNNSHVYQDITPVTVPNGAVIGFRTGDEVGTWTDGRVMVRLRRQDGEYVSDVTLI